MALSRAERILMLRAVLIVAAVRLGLKLLPATMLLRRVERSATRRGRRKARVELPATRVAWAVRAAARRVPGATCLTQALAARLLLAGYGHDARLRIGVRRSDAGAFEAHAWAEVGGRPVIGGRDVTRYHRLPDLASALRLQHAERAGRSEA